MDRHICRWVLVLYVSSAASYLWPTKLRHHGKAHEHSGAACRCSVEDLKGGDAALNAQILRDVFGGQQGAVADALCLNAGVALAASQVAASAEDGVKMAQVGALVALLLAVLLFSGTQMRIKSSTDMSRY